MCKFWKVMLPLVAVGLVAIAIFVVQNILQTDTVDNQLESDLSMQNDSVSVSQDLSIQIDDIITYLNSQSTQIKYSSSQSAKDFTYSFSIEDTTIAQLDNESVCPLKVGITRLKMECDYNGNKSTFYSEITVLTQFTYTATITDQNGNVSPTLYRGEYYYLVCQTENRFLNEIKIESSVLIKEITKIQNESNKKVLKFLYDGIGQCQLITKCNSLSCELSFNIYDYITQFDISFSREDLSLYLFNNEYKQLANNDGFYNVIEFGISTNQNAYQNFDINIEGNCACIEQNKIIAKNIGQCFLVVSSKDKNAFVKRQQITIKSIGISSLNFECQEQYNKGDSFTFEPTFSPLYVLNNLSFLVDGEKSLKSVNFDSTGTKTLEIIDSYTNIKCTKQTKVIESEYRYVVDVLDSFKGTNNITIDGDKITIDIDSDVFIPFTFNLISPKNEQYTESIASKITILEGNANIKANANTFSISATGVQTIKVKIELLNNPEIYKIIEIELI